MFSDIICEQLVKRKLTPKYMAIGAGIITGGVFLSFLAYAIGVYADPAVGLMGSMLFLCGIFITFYFGRFAIFVEYEYSFVNGELTIDKISAKSKRKHMLDVDVKSFEKMGKYDPEKEEKLKITKVCDFSVDKYDSDTIYAYFKDSSGNNTLLIFTPNEKLIGSMKTYVNNMVFREAFPNFKAAAKSSDEQ